MTFDCQTNLKQGVYSLKESEFAQFCVHRCKSVYQGPVVQSVVSLTSSLRVILLTVLADLIYNILIFFAEKM